MKNTKVILFLILFSLIIVPTAFAGNALLTWDANSEADLAGYKIYYGTSARSGTEAPGGYSDGPVDVGNQTSYVLRGLTNGQTYYFSLTAYDNAVTPNESGFSNEVSKAIIANLGGDLNLDRAVNIFDYSIMASKFGNTGCGNQADIDGNCSVNIFDFNLFVPDFGQSY